MNTIGVRELQQHASLAVRRVQEGETIGITVRGKLAAVLTVPSNTFGSSALLAAGRVVLASKGTRELPTLKKARIATSDVLNELRNEE
ncbi:MAG: type II toxin-antitoxin system prevent-host-death family antitoxin [Acidimicrobiales bacterium]|nr:type II toxin-antitoxin system prevent-host-death family antitoxin [Acidimicrobiales bacterium]